jgi:hypothetical protein
MFNKWHVTFPIKRQNIIRFDSWSRAVRSENFYFIKILSFSRYEVGSDNEYSPISPQYEDEDDHEALKFSPLSPDYSPTSPRYDGIPKF